ncbi:MAG: hypothetical protein QOG90_588 [Actinomycetota bacterium]|jgi:hypothetical protein
MHASVGRRVLQVFAAVAVIAGMLTWLVPSLAHAFSDPADEPVHVAFTLEACRLTAGTSLPIAGKFICPDAMYTTGNLGKSWNELDLVPHRLTTTAGTQVDASTNYKVSLAADGITGGKVGYDVLSAGLVNVAKSDASCTVSAGAMSTKGTAASPFGGGTDTVIYRDFTIHQNKGTTCVIDWYQRLALTSHLYPGSSLQSYMFEQAALGGSKKTLSIPVNQIAPQSLTKDMTASQVLDSVWNLTKSSQPGAVDFTNSCLGDGRISSNVTITVSWTKVAADPSTITLLTHVYATNPAARSITTTVTDKVYAGATQTTQVTPTESAGSPTHLTNTVAVPAFSTAKIIDFIGTVPAGTATSFNDVATGTYLDEVTNVAIPQTTTVSANATVSVSAGANTTASIVDTESISSGFHFKLTSTSGTVGTLGGYVVNTSTVGPLVWTSPVLSGDGSVTFNKTITADGPAVVTTADNKKLSDTANLVAAGGFATSASAHVDLTSGATLNVAVHKNIPSGVTGTQAFVFDVYAGSNGDKSTTGLTKLGSIPISITSPNTSGSGSLAAPATGTTTTFTIVEQAADHWASQPNQVLTIALPDCGGGANGGVTFTNTFEPAVAKVSKVTVPSGNEAGWTFTLTGPGAPVGGEHVTTTGAGYVSFTTALQAGDYVVAESPKSGFDFTSKSGDCSFTVTYPVDAGHNFACTFTNTERGSLDVTKTVDWNGVTPDAGQSFELCITGPSYPVTPNCKTIGSSGGKLTWSDLLHGDYVVTETNPGTSWVVSGGDGATATVNAGQTTTAAGVTNTRKLGSLQVTKNVDWNGVTPSQSKTFEICITGPSYPTGNCKTVDFDGATLTWTNLIPGNYVATESDPGTAWTVAGSPTGVISVPTNGGRATNVPVITNTRKLGSLQVTKNVDWNGVTPNVNQTFEICITGPSYPNGNCKTAGYNGGTLTWSNLIPGDYVATETNPGSSWTMSGSPTGTISVPSNGASAEVVPVITNTRKLGSLKVTKAVDWNGVTPDQSQTFNICITGPSYPAGDCKSIGSSGGTLTWTDLIPGNYTASENNAGTSWAVTGSPSGVISVPTEGSTAELTPTITNTRKLGSLQVTKSVDWNGVTPDATKTFEICITGPSYPNGNCKSIGSNGGTLTWANLIPGNYVAAESDPGTSWTVGGSPTATISVPSNGGSAAVVPVISNTRKHGSLKVTKAVEWNGVTPDATQTFEICITGPSYPAEPNCQSVGANGGTLTWGDLIPGHYTASETAPGNKWSVAGSPTGTITVPNDGGTAEAIPVITNTRKHGSLQVTKSVDWNGVTPDANQTFQICITGPSFPVDADCKSIGDNGGTLTWSNLIPGAYVASETNPGTSWIVGGSPSASIVVPSDGSTAELTPIITNTRKHGSLSVTKTVDWNGVTADNAQTFEICITGPSYPDANCKSVGANGGTLTWTDLIPGAYTAAETNPGTTWTMVGSPSAAMLVPNNGGAAANAPVITNTRKLGSLHVTKHVSWNGVDAVDGQDFSICISGPSYPAAPNCKTFTSPDGLEHTWSGLVPGAYTVSEPGLGTEWTASGDTSATVPTNGGTVSADVTNTRKHGSLSVTKAVDWNGLVPNENKTFSICIKGPSFPDDADCKTVGFNGGTVTWTDLIPGDYVASETNPGENWTIEGNPSAKITVPANGAAASFVPVITNTRKHGSLVVTKVVDWNGTTPDPAATFQICVTGPSYPTANCKSIGSNGGDLTWTDLQPGTYTVNETNPGASWTVSVRDNPAVVSASGGEANATVTNTHLPTQVLGEVLARTGGDGATPLALAGLAVVAAATRRLVRRRQRPAN